MTMKTGAVRIGTLFALLVTPVQAFGWSKDLAGGNDRYYIGCVSRAGLTPRIWGCDGLTGVWTQINVDCVMDEDIVLIGGTGGDFLVIGHGTDGAYSSSYSCGGETRSFGDITHSWSGNNWDILVTGNENNDTIYTDSSRYTVAIADSGDDLVRTFGNAGIAGRSNDDLLFAHVAGYQIEEMYGEGGLDCVQEVDDETATVFDCGTGPSNYYEPCCSGASPGQPDIACDWEVDTCEPEGPELVEGGGEGEGQGEEG